MGVIVLAGPPSVGHNTVAELVAGTLQRSAVVDLDDIRGMHRRPAAELGTGAEWERRYRLGIRQGCGLARSFADDGTDVVLLDVVEPEVLELFRAELAGLAQVRIILLIARVETLLQRDLDRSPPGSLDDPGLAAWHDRIRLLHGTLSAAAHQYDAVVDNSDLTPEETARAVQRAPLG